MTVARMFSIDGGHLYHGREFDSKQAVGWSTMQHIDARQLRLGAERRMSNSSVSWGSFLDEYTMDWPREHADDSASHHRVSPDEVPLDKDAPSELVPSSFDPSAEGLKPSPFFYYRDYSRVEDPDPTPLTPPGRVPNFVAKMHAILSRSDLSAIISWLSHGRSWMILNPKKFEQEVLPVYFEHGKMSSFIRQANGWGFRRFTTGRDRNSYYHPKFLRSLPHLCKDMKRPGVSKKQPCDPDHEPDLHLISQMFPVPEEPRDPSIYLNFILEQGPNARMPIFTGTDTSGTSFHQRASDQRKNLQPEQQLSIANPLAAERSRQDQQQLQLSYQQAALCAEQQQQQQQPYQQHAQVNQSASDSAIQPAAGNMGEPGLPTCSSSALVQLSQALAGLPHIPSFIPSALNNADNNNNNNFDPSILLLPPTNNAGGGNMDGTGIDAGSAAYQAGFMAAQAMFASSQQDQIEQQLLNDPAVFPYQPQEPPPGE